MNLLFSNLCKAEISALNNAGRLPATAYQGATMYTTLSPCDMCTGACLLYKVKRVVIGENKTFIGGEKTLKDRGIEVVVLQNEECYSLMQKFIKEKPELWYVNSCFFSEKRTVLNILGTKILPSNLQELVVR
jgi:cytosine/creatinine deaminase